MISLRATATSMRFALQAGRRAGRQGLGERAGQGRAFQKNRAGVWVDCRVGGWDERLRVGPEIVCDATGSCVAAGAHAEEGGRQAPAHAPTGKLQCVVGLLCLSGGGGDGADDCDARPAACKHTRQASNMRCHATSALIEDCLKAPTPGHWLLLRAASRSNRQQSPAAC